MRKFNWTVLILLLLVWGSIFAQTSSSIVAENVATKSPLYYNHTPNITRSSDGTLVAVWNQGINKLYVLHTTMRFLLGIHRLFYQVREM